MSGVPVQVHQVADAVACIVKLYGLSSGVANVANHLHVPGTLCRINRLLCSQALKCSKHALLS